jgi:signal transduction histidine kinase
LTPASTLHWFAAPELSRPDLRRRARALWIVSWPFFAVVTVVLGVAVLVEPDTLARRSITIAAVGALMTLLHTISRAGRPVLASWILVIGLSVIVTQRAWITGGIHAPVAVFYALFIVMASVLFGARGGLVTAAVCFVGAVVLTVGTALGWLTPRPGAGSPLGAFVFVVLAIGLALVLQALVTLHAEQQMRRSQAALRKSSERVRNLGSRLLNAQERERSRIARELHDDIGQQLAVLKWDLRLWGRTVQGHAEAVAAEAVKRTEEIAASVHDLSHRLHPARLRLMGLVKALDGLQGELSNADVTITFAHENVPPMLLPDPTLCLFRIAQEALQNALKYSKAHNVSVDLRGLSDGIALTIVDDGVGFDVDAVWGRGLGLISMHERVEALSGTFEIRSSPGAGTRLEVRLPASILHDTETV